MALPPLHIPTRSAQLESLKVQSALKLQGLSLKVGQTLQASVTQVDAKGNVQLQAGQHTLVTQSSHPLKQGQTLQLTVTGMDKQQRPVLQFGPGVTANPAPQTAGTQQQQQIMQALRSSLPKQGDIPSLATQLQSALKTPDLPQNIRQAIQQVVQHSLPLQSSMPAKDVQTAIKQSGQFLESTLAQSAKTATSAPTLSGDLKANLSRLLQQLSALQQAQPNTQAKATQTQTTALVYERPQASTQMPSGNPTPDHTKAPQQLLHPQQAHTAKAADTQQAQQLTQDSQNQILQQLKGKATGALHSIQTQQLQHLQTQGESSNQWQMTLPVYMEDQTLTLDLVIQKDASEHQDENADNNHDWQFFLHLDIPNLGPMKINVSLKNQQLTTCIIAEQQSTQQLLQAHADDLAQQLHTKDIQLHSFTCLHGKPRMPEQTLSALIEDDA